jgi:hypothetical protein
MRTTSRQGWQQKSDRQDPFRQVFIRQAGAWLKKISSPWRTSCFCRIDHVHYLHRDDRTECIREGA